MNDDHEKRIEALELELQKLRNQILEREIEMLEFFKFSMDRIKIIHEILGRQMP